MTRIINWWSAGAASAVASKLAITQASSGGRHRNDIRIVYTDPGAEHPDNVRFRWDCERWYGRNIEVLKSDKYKDPWEVWNKVRFLVSPYGAPCTGELKKKLRYSYQQPDDVHVFGFTADPREIKRAERLRAGNPELAVSFPLIEQGLTKQDCWGILERVGIELPEMYKLGYENNNCIGCVKGGMGYWNKIRRDFPDVFDRMAQLEQRLGATVLRDRIKEPNPEYNPNTVVDLDSDVEIPTAAKPFRTRSIPLPLIALDPSRGNYRDEPNFECGLLCVSTIEDFDETR